MLDDAPISTPPSSRMKRSWPWTIGWLITALVSGGLAVLAVQSALEPDGSWLAWVGAVLTGLFALVAGYLAIFSAGSITCVNCGKGITGFEPGNKEPQIGVCAGLQCLRRIPRRGSFPVDRR